MKRRRLDTFWFLGATVAVAFYGLGCGVFALTAHRWLLADVSWLLFLTGSVLIILILRVRQLEQAEAQLREASGRVVRLLDQAPKPACIYAEGCLHGEACELVERCLCDPEARPVMPGEFWNSGPC